MINSPLSPYILTAVYIIISSLCIPTYCTENLYSAHMLYIVYEYRSLIGITRLGQRHLERTLSLTLRGRKDLPSWLRLSKFPKSARTQTAVWFRCGLAVVALTTGGRLLTAADETGSRLLTACGGCLMPMADCLPLLSVAKGSGGWSLDDGERWEGGELLLSPMLFLLLIPAWLIDLTGNLKQRAKNNYWTTLRKLGKRSKKMKKTNQKNLHVLKVIL